MIAFSKLVFSLSRLPSFFSLHTHILYNLFFGPKDSASPIPYFYTYITLYIYIYIISYHYLYVNGTFSYMPIKSKWQAGRQATYGT